MKPRNGGAALAILWSPESQRCYRHEIDEFVGWNCSEPHLSFNSTVVTGHQIHLEDRCLGLGTTNVRLGTVRRLAHEATDSALQSQSLRLVFVTKGSEKWPFNLGTG